MLRFLARELHCWRVMHASSNGLVRRADRLETTTLVMLWIAALAGLMVALTVGGNTYAAHKATIEHQEPRHSVSATIIRTSVEGVGEPRIGAPSAGVPGVGVPSADVPNDSQNTTVAWQDPNGHRLTATVGAEPLDAVGRVRTVWLDDTGAVVGPPVTTTDAVMEGLIAGAGVVMLVVLVWWGSTVLVRLVADRHRSREWDAAWRQFDIDSHP
ncbi:hypothetical protein [Gordonia sp. SMJS1]|uniref:Rv1733c family protein n=1 Tax=Gordonia sp. SMJS1 TaxID=3039400 RepID=UPI0024574BA7|nr:hypothetical protein [Gordonia sp. SMJS1]WGJ86583.1 hypothetical protein QAD21_05345 [Gordonia sp. SMJS1]